jgi:transposase
MTDPQPIEIEAAEVERVIEQAQHGLLDPAAQKQIVPLLQTLLWLEHTLLETRISLAKLRKLLFGKRTEKTTRPPPKPSDGPADSSENAQSKSDPPSDPEPPAGDAPGEDGRQSEGASDTETDSGEPTDVGSDGQKPTPRPGHGRLGAADYPGAERFFCPHDQYQAGDRCPECTRGRLYRSRPLVRLRFRGQPLANVTRYELEQLRCGTCGALFVAHMPPEAGQETYDVSLKVVCFRQPCVIQE